MWKEDTQAQCAGRWLIAIVVTAFIVLCALSVTTGCSNDDVLKGPERPRPTLDPVDPWDKPIADEEPDDEGDDEGSDG